MYLFNYVVKRSIKIADKVIDGIISKVDGDDWGSAVGRLTSGLGK